MASECLPCLKEALPLSRSLVICAERFGFTGTGGGGTGDSRVRSVRCRSLRVVREVLRGRELDVVWIAFVVGSRVMGRRVNVSVSSIVEVGGDASGCCWWVGWWTLVA